MLRDTSIEVLKDVAATLIPTGVQVTLQKGTFVLVTQALGNAYTLYVNGNLVRVNGKDGDALGLVILESPDLEEMTGSVEDKVWALLKTCFDPEIPVNIVDLGLVYDCQVVEVSDDQCEVTIIMTLTAAGCGMGPVLVSEIEAKIKEINIVKKVTVDLVFDPPWDRDKMTEEARLQLGMM